MGAEKKVSYDLKRFAGIKRDYNQDDVERLISCPYSLLDSYIFHLQYLTFY